MDKIVIIGNGIAGITAARHIRKNSDFEIVVISAESKYFFSRTALMYVYMGHMKFEHIQPYENWFWKKNRIGIIQARVSSLDTNLKSLKLSSGETIQYTKLILALGSKPIALPIDGIQLLGVQSLYSKQDLELMEEQTQDVNKAVVIGGGLIGIEMAEMLHSRGIETHMIIREKSFWDLVLAKEESELVTDHILSQGIHLHLNTTVVAINGNEKVSSVTLDDGTTLSADFVGVTIGVKPNISLVEDSLIETERGILVNNYLQTNVEDIYAIGDCAQLRFPDENRKSIEPVWYTGRMMGETVAANITGKPTEYKQGIWFNSAKFFELEYQTYGYVPNQPKQKSQSIYWQDKKTNRALRLVFNKASEFIGLNSIGIRIRHEVCERWIKEKRTHKEIMSRLAELNFDPEFQRKFENDIDINTELV